MPGLFYQPVGRRSFLKTSTKALAACSLTASLGGLMNAAADEKRVHLALLSDTHIPADATNEYRKFFPVQNLKTVVPQVLEARPQAVIVDGDAARLTGQLEDYEALKGILTPLAEQCPVHIALGNHDNRETFLKVFPQDAGLAQKVAGKHVLVLEEPFLRVIILDSLLYVDRVAGLLGKAQRTWLDQYLASVDTRPVVLFVHHTLRDGDGDLLDVDALYRIVSPYQKVKAIFYGHSHQYAFGRQGRLHLVNLPAVGYNFSDKEPVGWVDAFFSAEGVDLTLRAIGGNRELDGKTTSLAWA